MGSQTHQAPTDQSAGKQRKGGDEDTNAVAPGVIGAALGMGNQAMQEFVAEQDAPQSETVAFVQSQLDGAQFQAQLDSARSAWAWALKGLAPDSDTGDLSDFFVRANAAGSAFTRVDQALDELRDCHAYTSDDAEAEALVDTAVDQAQTQRWLLAAGLSGEIEYYRNGAVHTFAIPEFPTSDMAGHIPNVIDSVRDQIFDVLKADGLIGNDEGPSEEPDADAGGDGDDASVQAQIAVFKGYAGKVKRGCDVAADKLPDHADVFETASEAASDFMSACDAATNIADAYDYAQDVIDKLGSFANVPTDFATLETEEGRKRALDGYSDILRLLGEATDAVGIPLASDVLNAAADSLHNIAALLTARMEHGLKQNRARPEDIYLPIPK